MNQVVETANRFFRRRDWLRRFVRRHAFFNHILSNVLPRYRAYAVRPGSDVLIEGFPRSANTFAVIAFMMSQPAPMKIGRHLHSLGHVRRGLQLGKPTLIVIRNPRDSVLSLAIAHPDRSLASLFKEYIDFYEGIERLGEAIVLGEFHEVTNDFGLVIRRLNARFSTNFREFEQTPENLERCYQLIDEEDRQSTGKGVQATRVARPNEECALRKRDISAFLEKSPARELLVDAQRVYIRLLNKHGLTAPESSTSEGVAALQSTN